MSFCFQADYLLYMQIMLTANTKIKLLPLQQYLLFLGYSYHLQHSPVCWNSISQRISKKGKGMYSF